MKFRTCCVLKVPAGAVVKIAEPSGFFTANQKFGSEGFDANFLSSLSRIGLPLMTRNCGPLPGPTPAVSLFVAIENGVPVWNCDTPLTVHPPSTLPISDDFSLKNGN